MPVTHIADYWDYHTRCGLMKDSVEFVERSIIALMGDAWDTEGRWCQACWEDHTEEIGIDLGWFNARLPGVEDAE